MYDVTHGTFRTPRGRDVTMTYRTDTNDYNALRSCLDEDEYRLAELTLSGTALDIGAHIGGASVALLIDNPELRLVAVEAVPPNVDLLNINLALNGLTERATVIHAAAGKGRTATVSWGYGGNATADHHAFIGNAVMPEADLRASHSQRLPVRTLASLVREFGPFSFAKADCEGCEFAFLQGPALADVALIRGEYHAPIKALIEALYPTFSVTWSESVPGAFEAVRRG